ncbi:MAG: hypothetical protein AMXMBFR53_18890 [Gemmatimonadota bacterium]
MLSTDMVVLIATDGKGSGPPGKGSREAASRGAWTPDACYLGHPPCGTGPKTGTTFRRAAAEAAGPKVVLARMSVRIKRSRMVVPSAPRLPALFPTIKTGDW